MRSLAFLLLSGCLAGDVMAGSCRTRARVRGRNVRLDVDAVFAVPVATVVVAAPPVLLYSYREALGGQTQSTAPSSVDSSPPPPTNAEQILRTHCAKCHQGASPRSGLAFFSEAGQLLTPLPRRAMLEMASPGRDGRVQMPPGNASKLGAEELEAIRAWAEPPRELRY